MSGAGGARLVDLWPALLACRRIDLVHPQLAAQLGLDPRRHKSAGLVTCDQDDALYIALDEATKHAAVDVVFGKSFYAGSKHASGPLSGEVLGILAGNDPSDVEEGLAALQACLTRVRFQTFPGDAVGAHGMPAFLAHVIEQTGRYLAPLANVSVGAPLAYLIAPPLEAAVAVDAALKAADVQLAVFMKPPSETNFAGAYLSGELGALEAARDAFVNAIADLVKSPMRDARRLDRARR